MASTIKNSSSLAALGERGDRKAVGEGVKHRCADYGSCAKASGSDRTILSTSSTNSSGASRIIPFENLVTVYPMFLRCASRRLSHVAWLGCPCTLPSSSTTKCRRGQQKSTMYLPSGCCRRNLKSLNRTVRNNRHAACSDSVAVWRRSRALSMFTALRPIDRPLRRGSSG